MAALIIISIIIFLLVIIVSSIGNTSSNNNSNKTRHLLNNKNDRFITENTTTKLNALDRYAQIINESKHIIENSKNLRTIKSRYQDVLYNWEMANNTNLVVVPNQKHFIEDFKIQYNYNIVRAVDENFDDYKRKVKELKTQKAIDNRTAKMFEMIQEAKDMLVDSISKDFTEKELEELHLNTEEFYSNLTIKN
ncbi:hypothetical protein PG587_09140 [Riemerella anatipestifer]|uniref:hypothetical protein n=1 Tax=Riemerella anatipestifer TaxID=34085 RepID=UPI0012B21235|nr:hypothetical protein [Riemerella anatipestifer]MDY3507027.1 hypothetical protein [Riemerella anatipestifer]MSN81988.1 hypothetical protein [Riemerella anatipestifer]UXN81041.1 hypothetical protein [Phage vB_RanS_PJN03]